MESYNDGSFPSGFFHLAECLEFYPWCNICQHSILFYCQIVFYSMMYPSSFVNPLIGWWTSFLLPHFYAWRCYERLCKVFVWTSAFFCLEEILRSPVEWIFNFLKCLHHFPFQYLHILTCCCCLVFIISFIAGVWLTVALLCISLINKDPEDLFVGLVAIHISSLVMCLYKSFAYF